MKFLVGIFLLFFCFKPSFAQDYIVKKNADTVYGKILHWKVNQVSIKTANGKYSHYKPSNCRSYYLAEPELTFRSSDVVNREGKIFLPETGFAKRFFFYSGADSLKMLKVDTFTIYVLQDKHMLAKYHSELSSTVKTNPNRLFVNIDDFAADKIYIETPSTGLNCIYQYDMTSPLYEKSFDLLRNHFASNKQLVVDMLLQRNTDIRQTQRPQFIYNTLYAFFSPERFPEFRPDDVDVLRFPF